MVFSRRGKGGGRPSMLTFIALVVVVVFLFDLGQRWWRENEWKRRWRKRDD
jgi:hypothetical protein